MSTLLLMPPVLGNVALSFQPEVGSKIPERCWQKLIINEGIMKPALHKTQIMLQP